MDGFLGGEVGVGCGPRGEGVQPTCSLSPALEPPPSPINELSFAGTQRATERQHIFLVFEGAKYVQKQETGRKWDVHIKLCVNFFA